jgi:outer membrane protein assembly factor BamB
MTGPAGGRPRHRRAPAALVVAAAAVLAACGTETEPPVTPRVPVRLVLTVSDTITVTGGTLTFAAVAVDSLDAPVAADPVTWSVTNPGRGTVTDAGVFTGGPLIGTLHVRARLVEPPLAESVAVRVVPPGTVRWTWPISEVSGFSLSAISGPALGWDGTIYVVVVQDIVQPSLGTLVALSPRGRMLWAVPMEGVDHNSAVVTADGAVVVAGKVVYVVEPDGAVRWQALMEANHPTLKGAAVGDGVAFVAHGRNLTALALAAGDTLWQSARSPFSSWLVPPTVVGSTLVYAKHTADTLFAFRQSDGTILKTYDDPDTSADMSVFGVGTVPVGDRFYLPTHGRLAAFDTAGPLLWLSDLWANTAEPVVGHDGVLYVQNSWGLLALNPDGATRWARCQLLPSGRCGEEQRWSWYGGGALASGGSVYGAGWDRFFAYDTAGTLLWQYQSDSAGVPQAFIGAPAIGPDGMVYTFTGTHVYAFWSSAPPEPGSPWPMWRHDAQRTGWAR